VETTQKKPTESHGIGYPSFQDDILDANMHERKIFILDLNTSFNVCIKERYSARARYQTSIPSPPSVGASSPNSSFAMMKETMFQLQSRVDKASDDQINPYIHVSPLH